jgi:predicted phosphodiesterase
MDQILAVITADCHLRQRLWSNLPAIKHDAFLALESIASDAISANAKLFVLAGDTFDNRRPCASDVIRLRALIDSLHAAGIAVRHIDGNHDKDIDGSWCCACGSTPLTTSPEDIGGVTFCGLSYMPSHVFTNALVDLPCCDVLVGHQALVEAGRRGDDAFSADDILGACHAKRIFLGDTHIATKYERDDRLVVSPGATHMTRIGEPYGTYAALKTDLSVDIVNTKWRRLVIDISLHPSLEGSMMGPMLEVTNALELLESPCLASEYPGSSVKGESVVVLRYDPVFSDCYAETCSNLERAGAVILPKPVAMASTAKPSFEGSSSNIIEAAERSAAGHSYKEIVVLLASGGVDSVSEFDTSLKETRDEAR